MNPDQRLQSDLPKDRWMQRLLQHRHCQHLLTADGTSDAQPPATPGRVLRLKLGYNPNSSSVGSVVSTLLWSATMGTMALNMAAVLIRRTREEHGPVVVGREAASNTDGAAEHGEGQS